MNGGRIVLVGNGFDLSANLKSSYSDFISFCFKDAIRNKINGDIIRQSKLVQLKDQQISSDVLSSEFVEIQSSNNIKQIIEFTNNYFTRIEDDTTHFFDLLVRSIESGASDWSDIETFYFRELIQVYDRITRTYKRGNNRFYNELERLNESFVLVVKELENYLSIQVKEFKLSTEEPRKTIDRCFMQDIIGYDTFKKPDSLLFINFNYTSILRDYLTLESPRPLDYDIINIHGRLNSEQNPVIFGFGDDLDSYISKIEEDGNNKFMEHLKSSNYYKSAEYQKILNFIDSTIEYDVFIIGHSAGISDRLLFRSILENKGKCKSVRIFHHKGYNDYKNILMNVFRLYSQSGKALARKTVLPFDKDDQLYQ